MALPVTWLLLPLALLREFATLGEGGGGLGGGRGAPALTSPPALRRSCHDLRAAVVPDVADRADAPGEAGGAALRSAAVQPGVGLLVALSASWTRHQPCLPNVHLQNPDQDGRGAEQQTDVGSEDPGHRLQPHPAQLPRRGARLLFLLGCRQLDTVLQPLRARLPSRSGRRGRGFSRCGVWDSPLNPFSHRSPLWSLLAPLGAA